MSPKHLFQVLLCMAALGAASHAHAGVVITPESFSVSSPDPSNPTEATNNIIDQSGLSANYVSGVTDFDSFVASTTATFSGQADLGGAGAPPSFFEFDFGEVVDVDAVAIWNQSGSASLDSFNVETSLLSDFSVSQVFGIFTMSIFGGAFPIAADVFTFNSDNFRFLRINNLTNAGFSSATRINEVAFRQVSQVPEPGYAGVLAIALPIVCWMMRRRRVSMAGSAS